MRRETPPSLPELSEFEVQRHYLHLSQMTLGMMGINLFGTCTMKYNPRIGEEITARPEIAQLHPHQHDDTLQGVLAMIHGLDLILRELSGMDQFVFQAGGGADAAYTHACVTRAYHASRGELHARNEIITTIQAHPCNAATAAAAGFDIITLPLEEGGYPSVAALRAAVSDRTAALMVDNPDDMGIYNPEIKEWVEIVHAAGGLCFYDHANFNGVMSKIRARELGFDACMFMLHKTFGAPKGGGGPAVGAYGCSAELAPFLPGPLVDLDGRRLPARAATGEPRQGARVLRQRPADREGLLVGARDGGRGHRRGLRPLRDREQLHGERLLAIRGVSKSHPELTQRRMEMTRYGLGTLTEETGVSVVDVQNRMVDFGVDASWLSHEPWVVPEPFTPEAGEMWSRRTSTTGSTCSRTSARRPTRSRDRPDGAAQPGDPPARHTGANDPERWATTWRAYLRRTRAPRPESPEPCAPRCRGSARQATPCTSATRGARSRASRGTRSPRR